MEEDLDRQRKLLEAAREADENTPKPFHLAPQLQLWQKKFTTERQNSVLGALVGNNFPSTAAALAGISVGCLNNWIRQGRLDIENGEDTEYTQFVVKYEQAIAIGEQKALGTVNKASERGDVRAATFLLERRHGKGKWEKTDRLEVGGDAAAPIVVELRWPGQRESGLPASAAAELGSPRASQDDSDDDVVDAELVSDEDDSAIG